MGIDSTSSRPAHPPPVMGKILWVDLTAGTCTAEMVPSAVYETYLGGLGLAAHYLFQRIPPHADPLGPDNVLAFVPGFLTGSGSMMTGRWMAAAKSPLTGTWGDANCGGSLAPAIKQAGYDGIFISGVSPAPVYLYVHHGYAALHGAAHLWGQDTLETESQLQSLSNGRQVSVACIGPAGEKCALISGIVNDQGRLAARSGLGAVMGSKKLKAVVVQGAYPVRAAFPAKMKSLTDHFLRAASFQPPFLNGGGIRLLGTILRLMPLQMRMFGLLYKIILTKYGTSGLNQFSVETGDSPIQNWGGNNTSIPTHYPAAVNPDRIRAREQQKYHCYSCPIGCGGFTPFRGAETHKPEYETVNALGALLMNEDLNSIYEANELLNRAGMDSISAGGTVAFAIECFENGLLTLEDTGGLQLNWGNASAILTLLRMMINREGLGDLLADGSRVAAEHLGQGSGAFAVQVGGQELGMHDARHDPGFALHAAVEPTPGRHTLGSYQYYEMFELWKKVKSAPPIRSLFYPKKTKYSASPEKALWAAACSQYTSLLNGTGACLFGAFLGTDSFPIFEWLNAATGWQKTPDEYMQIGWNIQTIRQAFNAREELPLSHPVHPRALGRPPLKQGANRGISIPIEDLTRQYWRAMGWDDQTGRPSESDLQALGLCEDQKVWGER